MKGFILLIVLLISLASGQFLITATTDDPQTCDLSTATTVIASLADGTTCIPSNSGNGPVAPSFTIACDGTQATTTQYTDADCTENPTTTVVELNECTNGLLIQCSDDAPTNLPDGQSINVYTGGCNGGFLSGVFTASPQCSTVSCQESQGFGVELLCPTSGEPAFNFRSSASALVAFPLMLLAALFFSF